MGYLVRIFGVSSELFVLHGPAAQNYFFFSDELDGFWIKNMLLFKYALGQRLFIVMIENGNGGLHDYGSAVNFFVNEVDSASRKLNPIINGLFLGIQAGKSRKQGRVNVYDSACKSLNELPTQNAHIAGEANKVNGPFF